MSTLKTILIPYKSSDLSSYIVEISYNNIRFYTNHGVRVDGDEIYSIKSPYNYLDLFDENGLTRIQYIQSGDLLYLFHALYPIKILYRDKFNEWHVEDFELRNGPWQSVNTTSNTIHVSEREDGVYAASNYETFSTGDVGRLLRLTVTQPQAVAWQAEKYYERETVIFSDNKYYLCTGAGTSGTIKPVHTSGIRSDGGVMWEYLHAGYGVFKITEYIANDSVKVVPQGKYPAELISYPTDYWELSVFGGDSLYPMSGAFFKGRFALLADVNNVPTVFMSCSDDYDNFADKEFGEVLDNSAITIPLYSNEYASPTFLISGAVLFAGTSSGEFAIDSASASNPLSPSNVQSTQFSSFGSLPIMPVRAGNSILYVSKQGVGLRNIAYSFENDGYESIDISLFGKHLLNKGISQIIYQELPDKIIWIATQDGRLVGLTYMTEQNVAAYHRHDLSGFVNSIAVIPNPDTKYEDLWLEVERDGSNCIEWMDEGFSADKAKAYFIDSGLEIERTFTTTFDDVIKETSGALKNTDVVVYSQNQFRETLSATGEDIRSIRVHGEKRDIVEDCGVTWVVEGEEDVPYTFEIPESMLGFKVGVSFTYEDLFGDRKAERLIEGTIQSSILNFIIPIKGNNTHAIITFDIDRKKDDISISGLDHLEGMEVKVIIDGAEKENQIVNNGSITVPYDAKKIEAGLPIKSVYIPQVLYMQTDMSSGVGDVQRIDHVTLMMWNSMGGMIGQDTESLNPIYYRDTDAKMDNTTPLFTGNKKIPVNFNTTSIKEKGATVVVYNDSIFPMCILAIAPHFSTSGGGL